MSDLLTRNDQYRNIGYCITCPQCGMLNEPGGKCYFCDISALVAALVVARTLPPAQLGAIVACCRDNGARALADALVGELPFDGKVQ